MLLFINRLFFLDGESVGEPKSSEQWPVAVEKDYGYMAAMVADVSHQHQDMDMRVNQTHIMAPQERPSRPQIIFRTQQCSHFK